MAETTQIQNKTLRTKKAKQVLAFRIDPRLKKGSEIYQLFFRDKMFELSKDWLNKTTFTSNELIKRILFSYIPPDITDEYSFLQETIRNLDNKHGKNVNKYLYSIAPRMTLESYKKSLYEFFNSTWFQETMTKIQQHNIDFEYPQDKTVFTLESRYTVSFIKEWFIKDIYFLINRILPISEQNFVLPVLPESIYKYEKVPEQIPEKLYDIPGQMHNLILEKSNLIRLIRYPFEYRLKKGISKYQTQFLLDLIGHNNLSYYTVNGLPSYVYLLKSLILDIDGTDLLSSLLLKLQEYLFSLIPDTFFTYHFTVYVQPTVEQLESLNLYYELNKENLNKFKLYILELIDRVYYSYTTLAIEFIFFRVTNYTDITRFWLTGCYNMCTSPNEVKKEIISDIVKEVVVIRIFFNILINRVIMDNPCKYKQTFFIDVYLFNKFLLSKSWYTKNFHRICRNYAMLEKDSEAIEEYKGLVLYLMPVYTPRTFEYDRDL